MRKHIKDRILANLEKNKNRKRLVFAKPLYEQVMEKVEAAKIVEKHNNASESQKNRRRKEKAAAEYLKAQQLQKPQLGDENLLSNNLPDSEVKIKLPYRLQLALDQLEQEQKFEESDFGRLMRS